jgi:hypothetical protein
MSSLLITLAGYLTTSVITIAIGLFILWGLYGHDASEEFFART